MKTLIIHGSYASDGLFNMSSLSVDPSSSGFSALGLDTNDFNIAMQALRLRGIPVPDDGEEKYLRVIPLYQLFTESYTEGDERVESNTDWNVY